MGSNAEWKSYFNYHIKKVSFDQDLAAFTELNLGLYESYDEANRINSF